MKIKICYNVSALISKLEAQGYNFVNLDIYEEAEDWEYNKKSYYFAKPEVKKISYFYGFGTAASIELKDGRKIEGFGDNISSNVEHVRLSDNDYISPKLFASDNWVESTDELVNWLLKRGVTMEDLENCKQEFTIYETVEYIGVPTPSKSHGYWGYSSKNLVLDEKEIKTILDSFKDELLREKVKCILYARVFKRRL